MEIQLQDAGEVKIAVFEGNLDTNTALQAEETLDKAIEGGAIKILVDFAKLDYISSAGLRVLLSTAKKLRAAGGNLRLCSLNEMVTEVFDISGFSTILTVTEGQEEALQGF